MESKTLAKEFLTFLNASPTPFHAVQSVSSLLAAAGFLRIRERDEASWNLQPGGKYFFTRNQSTIVAFLVGAKFVKGNGISLIGAHTDSPCLKVKPHSNRCDVMQKVAVELYGGGLWNTWFDRDLSVAGRVVVDHPEGFVSTLVHLTSPLLRIPSLAIHLNREIYSEGFKPNFETHLVPILSVTPGDGSGRHSSRLVSALAENLKVSAECIRDFDLCLYETNQAVLGGIDEEFVFGGRLDNLFMSFCAIKGLLQSSDDISEELNVRAVMLFDHEEVGSVSAEGADSALLLDLLQRVSGDLWRQSARRSFLISADMAHALHPNYKEKHETHHQPLMGKGLVLKHNAKQRYATNAVGAFFMKEIAQRNDIPMQEFVVRNDSVCGSTIGPILAAKAGVRTIDLGAPQLSMHSIREMGAVEDLSHSVKLFDAFFKEFPLLDVKLTVD